ncbi:recombinase family protein [Psychrobacillus vulpis]|nr:recombinase family protein [Psychrobacillus vulpis]
MTSLLERKVETNNEGKTRIDMHLEDSYNLNKVNASTSHEREEKDSKMKCAVYIRVSTNKEEQKESLISQKELAFAFIKSKGWTFYDVYTDVATGTNSNRPQFQRLIKDAEEQKFDVILTKELSRLARNGATSYQLRDLIEQKGIELATVDGNIGFGSQGKYMFGILTAIFEQESRTMSGRIKSVYKMKAKKGKFLSSTAPLGYEIKDKKLFVRNDETPDIVRRIFREYISGSGHDAIARGLYNEGIPTPSFYADKSNKSDVWHGSTVRGILTNPNYTGAVTNQKYVTTSLSTKKRKQMDPSEWIIVEDVHEPIISKAQFQLVQNLILERKKIRPQSQSHLFSNLLFCADCGRGMHFKKNSKGYVCGNFNKHGSKRCSNHRVRELDLTITIQSELCNLTRSLKIEDIEGKLLKKIERTKKEKQKKYPTLEKKLANILNKKNKATAFFLDEQISQDNYNDFIASLEVEERKLQIEISSIKESSDLQFEIDIIKELKTKLISKLNFEEITPEILNYFISKIEIKADGSPRIHYRFSETSALYLSKTSNAQHSTCVVCGNMSTG